MTTKSDKHSQPRAVATRLVLSSTPRPDDPGAPFPSAARHPPDLPGAIAKATANMNPIELSDTVTVHLLRAPRAGRLPPDAPVLRYPVPPPLTLTVGPDVQYTLTTAVTISGGSVWKPTYSTFQRRSDGWAKFTQDGDATGIPDAEALAEMHPTSESTTVAIAVYSREQRTAQLQRPILSQGQAKRLRRRARPESAAAAAAARAPPLAAL